jgi:hypothetical protein
MSETSAVATTTTLGYANGARWPIQLVISKFNITLTLKPGEYLLDRQGRKINDPYFDVFVRNKQLIRETSKVPVPLIKVPEVTVGSAPTAQASPVRAITQFKLDDKGVRRPVLEEPKPAPAVDALPAAVMTSASDAVRPMSMEEARRRGFVRKVPEVPEDFGVTDTTGLPPSHIPGIKYSIDPSVGKPVAPLPQGMLQLPKDDPARQARATLISNLTQVSSAPAPENLPENTLVQAFANKTVVETPPDSPIMAGMPVAESLADKPISSEPMPLPDIKEVGVDVPPAEEMAPPAEPAPDPLPEPAPPLPDKKLMPLTPRDKFACSECGTAFKFRSQLNAHAQSKHPALRQAIMDGYPVGV